MLDIRRDDVTDPRVVALLARHLDEMRGLSPPESVHALDLDGLKRPDMTLWTAWDGDTLLGCGGLKTLDESHGEVKSFHTAREARGRGVATAILAVVLEEARQRGFSRLSLETGTPEPFRPARDLYERHGFAECPPFGDYREDPFSVCMTRVF